MSDSHPDQANSGSNVCDAWPPNTSLENLQSATVVVSHVATTMSTYVRDMSEVEVQPDDAMKFLYGGVGLALVLALFL